MDQKKTRKSSQKKDLEINYTFENVDSKTYKRIKDQQYQTLIGLAYKSVTEKNSKAV